MNEPAPGVRKEIIDGKEVWYFPYDPEALRFQTIAEFLDVMRRGAEVVISWKDVDYGIFLFHDDEEHGGKHYEIAQCGTVEVNRATTMCCKTPDEILEYRVGGDRLRDVITQVEVLERTF